MSKFDKEVQALLRQAMEQPGVADAMAAYQAQQPAMTAFVQAQSALLPRWIVSTSSSTRSQS